MTCGFTLESMAKNGIEYSVKRGKGGIITYLRTEKGEKVHVFGGAIRVSQASIADLERAQEELKRKQQIELFYID